MTDQHHYIYEFKDITDTGSDVRMIVPHLQGIHDLQVYVNDRAFARTRQCREFPGVVADFTDLAISLFVADWLSKRHQDIPCSIHVRLPLRHPEIFGDSYSIELLKSVLYWFTETNWDLDFTHRTASGRFSESQLCIPRNIPVEVALWSGGLDALAGLYNRKFESRIEEFALFGTGSSRHILGLQQRLAERVSNSGIPTILTQLSFFVNRAKRLRKNSELRLRGFAFILLGIVCAYLENQRTLYIYENGIGAMNLPFRAAEVGIDHSRSVHPISLVKMSRLVSHWLGSAFAVENPFLFETKAQMCQVFHKVEGKNIVSETISCDSRNRQKGYEIQCGYCSSCLLRRQSLTAAGLGDSTKYVITHSRRSKPRDRLHFRAMQFQVEKLRVLLGLKDPWYHLSKEYPVLMEIEDNLERLVGTDRIKAGIIQLYSRHIEEWDAAHDIVGKEILIN